MNEGRVIHSPMPKRTPLTLTEVRRLLLALPGVEEGPCYGTPGFRVRGRFLARLWEDGETLVVKCGADERDGCRPIPRRFSLLITIAAIPPYSSA